MTAHKGKFVAYYRVSTDKQGRSGLGLEAQRKAVLDFLNGGDWELVAELTEVESGRVSDRPELQKALAACKRHKATLIIARLDRLARNVHFISGLMERKIKFVACDMPEATPFMLQIYAAVGEQVARTIGENTKVALAAAKARGVKLGRNGAEVLAPAYRAAAVERAMQLKPVVQPLVDQGLSMRDIASELTRRKIKTPRGGAWHPQLVSRVVERFVSGS